MDCYFAHTVEMDPYGFQQILPGRSLKNGFRSRVWKKKKLENVRTKTKPKFPLKSIARQRSTSLLLVAFDLGNFWRKPNSVGDRS
jgi:hypothetical protein